MSSITRRAKAAVAFGAVAALGLIALSSPALAQPVDVPEPSSMALMALGVGAVAIYHKFRKRK